ncbi:MAG: YgiT-type zinc finger protein [Terriglobia bacterium]
MKSKADFCEYCGSSLAQEERLVTVYRHRRERHFIFERVPARVCETCGERYFAAQTVAEMDRLMRKRKTPASLVSVPVIALRPAG